MYTLSHPENDRDVTEPAQGYTLQDGRSQGETKYSKVHFICIHCTTIKGADFFLTSLN